MYRVVSVIDKLRIPLPKSAGPQGELFETVKGALKFGKGLHNQYPESFFEVEEYGPISPRDWLVCNDHNVALRPRSFHLHEGCTVRKLKEGGRPSWYNRLAALLREWGSVWTEE